MKSTQIVRLMATLAFSALIFSACNKAATNTNNSNSTSNTNSSSTTTGDKKASGDYSTPTTAFKAFYEAAKASDVEGMKRSVSGKSIEMMTQGAAKDNKTLDEAIKEMSRDAPASFPETRNEKIDGEKAQLEFKDDKMKAWATAWFVKEKGEWKLSLSGEEAATATDQLDSEKK